MADRFPSLDDFDAGQTHPQPQPSHDSEEPTDFLARERAALGEDAQQFTSSADPNAASVEEHDDDDDDDDDLLGGGGSAPTNGTGHAHADMMGDFESSFPAVDTSNDAVAPGGSITGSTLPPQQSFHDNTEDEEPEVLTTWRQNRASALEKRDALSSSKKSETVSAAREAVDEFYVNYNNRKDKSITQTRKEAEEFLQNREDTTSGGTSWERIAKLVDLQNSGRGKGGEGKERMRELLGSLRGDEGAPGAKGY